MEQHRARAGQLVVFLGLRSNLNPRRVDLHKNWRGARPPFRGAAMVDRYPSCAPIRAHVPPRAVLLAGFGRVRRGLRALCGDQRHGQFGAGKRARVCCDVGVWVVGLGVGYWVDYVRSVDQVIWVAGCVLFVCVGGSAVGGGLAALEAG